MQLSRIMPVLQRHEPYMENRPLEQLSFEGYSCYLMDQENFAVSADYGCRLKDVSLIYYMIIRFCCCLEAKISLQCFDGDMA